MTTSPEISVAISTYNRCALLPLAIESILAQELGSPEFEIVVVDNNSSDGTADVVARLSRRAGVPVRYVFEGKQGISHGRNAAVRTARARIVAFMDDDVLVAPNWLKEIKRVLDLNPDVDFVGGKVLPRWPDAPPSWLTREHWAPLALADFGDVAFHVNSRRPTCLVTASIAFRRNVFAEFGWFDPMFQHAKGSLSGAEDHEFELRLFRGGRQGMYAPSILATADVQPNRLTKAYHRKWHSDHGRVAASLVLFEGGNEAVEGPAPPGAKLFGVPKWILRQAVSECLAFVRDTILLREGAALLHEGALRERLAWIRYIRTNGHPAPLRTTPVTGANQQDSGQAEN